MDCAVDNDCEVLPFSIKAEDVGGELSNDDVDESVEEVVDGVSVV